MPGKPEDSVLHKKRKQTRETRLDKSAGQTGGRENLVMELIRAPPDHAEQLLKSLPPRHRKHYQRYADKKP